MLTQLAVCTGVATGCIDMASRQWQGNEHSDRLFDELSRLRAVAETFVTSMTAAKCLSCWV
jgi:hypothetical protein